MPLKFHRGGKTRAWIGAKFGGDLELGDRIWRRCLHFAGLLVLVYYVLPPRFFWIVPNLDALLLALGAVLVLELLRHFVHAELPTIRPHERNRVASFAFYAVALVAAVVLFPPAIAVAVVLGVSLIDPLIGEMRVRRIRSPTYPALPVVAYFGVAFVGILVAGRVPFVVAVPAAAIAAGVAVAAEAPRVRWADDDLVMTLAPAAVLLAMAWALPYFAPLRG